MSSPAPRLVARRSHPNREAETLLLVSLAALGLGDAFLDRAGKPLVTDALRHHRIAYCTFVTLLTLHVFDALGPFDPFRVAGRVIRGAK